MKKICILIFALIVLCLSGCGRSYDIPGDVIANRFIVITSKKEDLTEPYIERHAIAYDKDTKVIYFINLSHSGGITPLYNSDGSLQIYKGNITSTNK